MPAGPVLDPMSFGDLLLRRAGDDNPAVLFENAAWSYRELVDEGARRASMFRQHQRRGAPPHVGVLLDNVPEFLFWLTAAAISDVVVVALNSTYRGANLVQLLAHTECQVLVTSSDQLGALSEATLPMSDDRVLVVDEPAYAGALDAAGRLDHASMRRSPDDLFVLIFTSGSTGLPKAVRCTQGRLRRTAEHVARTVDLTRDDVVYSAVPMFHAAFLSAAWSPAVEVGAPIATRRRFSASQTIPDIRRFGATYFTYTGRALNYVLATPEQPDDAGCPLRLALGNEASARDIEQFARRFGCRVHDSYGATEGVIRIRRDPSMPPGALGRPDDAVKVLDPETGAECPPVVFGEGLLPLNLENAIGEIVHTDPTAGFEGYYKNDEATRQRYRDGCYWSGDLAYRDGDGWLYFAGRSNDWLRVDGENFAAAPVESILARHPRVRSVAVYAVPDEPTGDRVMAALELAGGAPFDAGEFDEFVHAQPDLGTKWAPAFVRVDEELPKLANLKLDKSRLRREAWTVDGVWWRPVKGASLRPMSGEDRVQLDVLLRLATGRLDRTGTIGPAPTDAMMTTGEGEAAS
jgi:fatty-acyl-CoA synthase